MLSSSGLGRQWMQLLAGCKGFSKQSLGDVMFAHPGKLGTLGRDVSEEFVLTEGLTRISMASDADLLLN